VMRRMNRSSIPSRVKNVSSETGDIGLRVQAFSLHQANDAMQAGNLWYKACSAMMRLRPQPWFWVG